MVKLEAAYGASNPSRNNCGKVLKDPSTSRSFVKARADLNTTLRSRSLIGLELVAETVESSKRSKSSCGLLEASARKNFVM